MIRTRYTGTSALPMVVLPWLKKGGHKVGKTKRRKGTKWMVLVDGSGTLLRAYLDSASLSEVKLLGHTLGP